MTKDEKRFANWQGACNKRFQRLQEESDKTLNILASIRRLPESAEYRTALILHMDEEEKAIKAYEKHRRRICALILGDGVTPEKPG